MSGEAPRDAGTVVTEADLAAPPETVWRALTTPEILAEWLGPNDLPAGASVGDRFGLDAPNEPGGRVACEILEIVPNQRLAFGWVIPAPDAPHPRDTVVEFELAPLPDGGTRLRIVHREAVAAVGERVVIWMGIGQSDHLLLGAGRQTNGSHGASPPPSTCGGEGRLAHSASGVGGAGPRRSLSSKVAVAARRVAPRPGPPRRFGSALPSASRQEGERRGTRPARLAA